MQRNTETGSGEELYYIQNGYAYNCLSWWREGGKGYTCNIDEAWKVTKEHAIRICSLRPDQDKMYPVSLVEPHIVRHVINL